MLAADTGATAGLGTVIVHLPQRLSLHGAALLVALGQRGEVEVLAGVTGDDRADAEVLASVRRLSPDVSLPPRTAPLAVVSGEHTRIVTTSDADDEVRAAVRALIDAVRQGTPLDRIAIVYGSRDPYARLVHEQLDAAGIAHNGAAVIPLTERAAGRTLLGLLALPASGFRRAEVFAWLSGAPFRHQGRPVPVTAWERLSREAGVVAGRHDWDGLLSVFAESCDDEAERAAADPDAPEWKAERKREEAARARALRDFVLSLIGDLAGAATPKGWAEQSAWARRRLTELLGSERRRARWPLVEQKAFERMDRALDRLAGLAEVEGAVTLDVFARTLELELDADLGRVRAHW